MDKKRIKNLILLTLLLVNAIFLGLLAADRRLAAAERESAWEELTEIFAREGIELSPAVRKAAAAQGHTLRRDAAKEYGSVAALLGEVDVSDQGGNIYSYSGEKGSADFQGTGDFSLRLDSGKEYAEGELIGAAKSVLKKLDIRVDPSPTKMAAGEPSTMAFTVTWRGVPVYNARVEFRFFGGGSIEASGLRMMDTVAGRGRAGMEPMTILMHFLRASGLDGRVSQVTDLLCGYFINASAAGDAELIPVWRIDTDAGEYYLNGYTGKVEVLS